MLRAPEGLQLKLTAETVYMAPTAAVLHVYGDAEGATELGMLRGMRLPQQQQDREFVSTNGALKVLLSEDGGAGLPVLFGLRIACVCAAEEPDVCGEHASCVDGQCQCDGGYGGPMCELIVDKCKAPVVVDCGAHGSCDDGNCVCSGGYAGSQCQTFACQDIDCGAHGQCELGGTCTCHERYTGAHCEMAPLQCCSTCITNGLWWWHGASTPSWSNCAGDPGCSCYCASSSCSGCNCQQDTCQGPGYLGGGCSTFPCDRSC